MWTENAAIVFVCVTANHLGLVAAAEKVIRHPLPVVNCPKCSSFWGVLLYGLASWLCSAAGLSGDGATATHPSALPRLLAVSLLCSYLAIWLELLEGFIDRLYNYLYEQIYPTADNAGADT